MPPKAKKSPLIRFDSLDCGVPDPQVVKEMLKWFTCGNPTVSNPRGKAAAKLIKDAKSYIHRYCSTSPSEWEIIFTSGESEANCLIITMAARAYARKLKTKPNLLISSIENISSIKCCDQLKETGEANITYINPNDKGIISSALVNPLVRKNTCLVSVASVTELGASNDYNSIGAVAHSKHIPFHCNFSQSFWFEKPDLKNVDCITVTPYKFGGPPGIGFLMLRKTLRDGYEFRPVVLGPGIGLKGEIYNVPAIAGTIVALKLAIADAKKNAEKLGKKKKEVISKLDCKSIFMYSKFTKKTTKSTMLCSLRDIEYNKYNILPIFVLNKKINTIARIFAKNNIYVTICSDHIISALNLKSFATSCILISFNASNMSKTSSLISTLESIVS